jgi:hypothetical protein
MEDYEDIDDSSLKFYSISDIDDYCHETRTLVASSFADNITEKEIDQYISIGQVEKFVDEFCDDHDENGSPIICEDSHNEICEAILTRIQNVGIAKLAANGTINVAFDEKLNDFIFWAT